MLNYKYFKLKPTHLLSKGEEDGGGGVKTVERGGREKEGLSGRFSNYAPLCGSLGREGLLFSTFI